MTSSRRRGMLMAIIVAMSQPINAQELEMSMVPPSAPHMEASKKQESSKRKSTSLSKKGTPNKRWSTVIDDFLIPFLVEQSKSGLKVDKGFKKTAYVAAASTVNAKFNTTFDAENVENHMRTLRAKYAEIKKCKEISGAGWNEELKMIILEGPTYATYVEAHPKAADVLNKPIKHYDALKIICGDDQATGQFCSTIYDNYINDSADEVNIEARNEMTPDDDSIEGRGLGQDGSAFTLTNNNDAIPSSGKSRGKRPREANDEHFHDLIATVKEVVVAIKTSATAHWSDNLWPKIVEAGGYSSEVYDAAYSFLYNDEKQGRLFMSKPTESRRAWLDRFVANNFSRFTDYI